MPRCATIKVNGERCGAPALLDRPGDPVCNTHAPELQEERQAARRRAAASTARTKRAGLQRIRALREKDLPPPPRTIEDVDAWAIFLLQRGATGGLDPRIHGACNRTLERVLRPMIEALETSREVRRLRAELEQLSARQAGRATT